MGVAPEVSLKDVEKQSNATVLQPIRLQGASLESRADRASTPGSLKPQQSVPQRRGLPFDEESKLIYGILYSLRSMVKKLSNKEYGHISHTNIKLMQITP